MKEKSQCIRPLRSTQNSESWEQHLILQKKIKIFKGLSYLTSLNPCNDLARQAERLIINTKIDAQEVMCVLKSHMDLLTPLPFLCGNQGLVLFCFPYVSRNSTYLKVKKQLQHWVPEQECSTRKLSASAAARKTIFRCFSFANCLCLRGEFLWQNPQMSQVSH